jgi:protein-S-isoprenylcysteine O-methyltransferase Ste14
VSERSKQGGPAVRFPPPLVFLGALLAGIGLQFAKPLAAPVGWIARAAVATPLIVVGPALAIWARGGFKRIGRTPQPWLPSSALIVEGPYRFTRNPMYVGMTALLLGLAAALDNGWLLVLAPIALVIVHVIAVRPEERYLEETFGESYVELKRRVRRYL